MIDGKREIHTMKQDILTSLFLVVLAACASFAVNDDVLAHQTSQKLAVKAADLTIAHRKVNGDHTVYEVQTRQGRYYDCSVSGTVSVMGHSMSEPVCRRVSQATIAARHRVKTPS